MLTWSHKNIITYILVFIFLAISASLAIFSSRGDAGIVDEIAHIPAGYSYLDKFDYRLNPEHPPLAKALAAIPLKFLPLNKPYSDWSWDGINQWEQGWYFLYKAGNNPDQILFWSRLPIILLMLATGLILFFWAKKLYGKKTALLVLVIFLFSPNILAHGRLVTTDIAATFGFLISIISFDNYLRKPTWQNLILAGLLFGIALLLKFSTVLLVPIFGVYILVKAILERNERPFWSNFLAKIGWTALICLFGFLLNLLVYIILTWNTPIAVERQLIDLSFPGDRSVALRELLKTLAGIPILKAFGHWLLGFLMVFSHTVGGHTAYLLGQFSRVGWWYFFPLAYLFKEPLPVIILLLVSIFVLFVRRPRDKEDVWNLTLFLTPIVVYFAVSMKGSLNIGIRHLLPTFPFIYLLIARTVRPYLIAWRWNLVTVALIVLGAWYLGGTFFAYPKYLAYFNELRFLISKQKYEILVDSSLDWGQDLKRLAYFVQENNIQKIKVDYFGGGVPSYYIPQSVEWHSQYGPTSGWIAISATFLEMSKYFGPQENQADYSWLENYQPVTIIGDSILVYNINR